MLRVFHQSQTRSTQVSSLNCRPSLIVLQHEPTATKDEDDEPMQTEDEETLLAKLFDNFRQDEEMDVRVCARVCVRVYVRVRVCMCLCVCEFITHIHPKNPPGKTLRYSNLLCNKS